MIQFYNVKKKQKVEEIENGYRLHTASGSLYEVELLGVVNDKHD